MTWCLVRAYLVHAMKNTRSQLFSSAVPNATAVAEPTGEEARLCQHLQMPEPKDVRSDQVEQQRANAGPAKVLAGGVKALVTPAPGTACTVNGSVPGSEMAVRCTRGADVSEAA